MELNGNSSLAFIRHKTNTLLKEKYTFAMCCSGMSVCVSLFCTLHKGMAKKQNLLWHWEWSLG